MKVNPDGSAKLDLGQAIDISKVHIETWWHDRKRQHGGHHRRESRRQRRVCLRKTTVTQDGKVSVDLGIKTGDFQFTGPQRASERTSRAARLPLRRQISSGSRVSMPRARSSSPPAA